MIGDSAVANYLLNRQSKVGVDHFAVAFTFGIAGMLGIAASFPISGWWFRQKGYFTISSFAVFIHSQEGIWTQPFH